jgi:hypothetical protein
MMDELKHVLPYDPVKAHDYYLRTRHLKGRHGAVKLQPSSKGSGAKSNAPNTSKPVLKTKAKPQKTAIQQRAEVEAKVKHLKTKLANLRKILRELLNKSQGRTVVDSQGRAVSKLHPVKKQSSAGSTKLTTAQKRTAAKASKKYRQTHKQQLSLKEQQDRLTLQIVDVENKIAKARDDLKASVVKARTKVMNRQ